jgi:hypothetical protein
VSSLHAYCAGVVDSDGTIGIKRSTYGMRHGNGGQATYSERVCVRQVTPEAVGLLHSAFGGSFGKRKASAVRGRPLWEWAVTDQKAATFLRAVRPYLRIKSLQANNCLALRALKDHSKKQRVAKGRGHVGSSRRTPEMSEAMEALYQRAKELNRVGV